MALWVNVPKSRSTLADHLRHKGIIMKYTTMYITYIHIYQRIYVCNNRIWNWCQLMLSGDPLHLALKMLPASGSFDHYTYDHQIWFFLIIRLDRSFTFACIDIIHICCHQIPGRIKLPFYSADQFEMNTDDPIILLSTRESRKQRSLPQKHSCIFHSLFLCTR